MKNISGDVFDLVMEVIQQKEPIFSKYGLILTENKQHDLPGGGHYLRCRFAKNTPELTLSLTFVPSTETHQGGFSATFYNRANEQLDVRDFLELHGYVAERILFSYTKDVPDLRKYVEAFLTMLDRVFSGPLKPILAGEKWESTPIDWQGYK